MNSLFFHSGAIGSVTFAKVKVILIYNNWIVRV